MVDFSGGGGNLGRHLAKGIRLAGNITGVRCKIIFKNQFMFTAMSSHKMMSDLRACRCNLREMWLRQGGVLRLEGYWPSAHISQTPPENPGQPPVQPNWQLLGPWRPASCKHWCKHWCAHPRADLFVFNRIRSVLYGARKSPANQTDAAGFSPRWCKR